MHSIPFDEAFRILKVKGPAQITSSIGTKYTIKAWIISKGIRKNEPVILAHPAGGGNIYIHADCWGMDFTCQGTRAGGIYNGTDNIFAWLNNNK